MPNLIPREYGWIETIAGPMYSGKSSELIRRLKLAEIARQKVVVFKPSIDNRFSSTHIVSRMDSKLPCVQLHTTKFTDSSEVDVLDLADESSVIGFDEAQFFSPKLKEICERLACDGKRVIVAGLDSDYLGEPFETVTSLMSASEYVDKLLAVCVVCGNPASKTYRISGQGGRVLIGDTEAYEARCRVCFTKPEETSVK